MRRLLQRTNVTYLSMLLLIITCSSKENTDSKSIYLDQKPLFTDLNVMDNIDLSGKYVGEWNGNLGFTGVLVSAIINKVSPDKDRYEGNLFITDNFTSCCNSGDSDGSIKFKVNEGEVSGFVWHSIIPDCKGTFTGSGKIQSDGGLELFITGTDCDGNHRATITMESL